MGYSFVNPYNFIPLGNEAPIRKSKQCEGTLSGVIEYSIYTRSPLFIPNTSNDDIFGYKKSTSRDENYHKSYEFFSYEDLSEVNGNAQGKIPSKPVIPGSEMRGLIRNNYEILTNSCLSSIDSDTVMQKRVAEVFASGLIKKNENGTYDLYEAEDCLLRTISSNNISDDNWEENSRHFAIKSYIQKDFSEGQKITFVCEKRRGKFLAKMVNKPGSSEIGYIIKGSDGPDMTNNGEKPVPKGQKHCCHVFKLKSDVPKHKSIKMSYLTRVLKVYGDRYEEYQKCLQSFMNNGVNEYFPVYYSAIFSGLDTEVFLSPASITRESYERKLADMVGKHTPCSSSDELCPACRLFGMLRDGEGAFAIASRVRFSDLEADGYIDSKCWEDVLTLEPLASPRLNNMEFYLKKPEDDAVFWTYDYYIDKRGNIHKNNSGINGRKFYWHDLNKNYKSAERSVLNVTVRPLKPGVKFDGKVYFSKLSQDELDMLIYVLNAGAEDEKIEKKTYGYKLGHAKPLGFGSVAIKVNKVEIRTYKFDEEKKEIVKKESILNKYNVPHIDGDILENFCKMIDFNVLNGMHVDYPRMVEEGDIFEWFTRNHRGYDRDKNKELNMPNKRIQMYYANYLEPMNPKVVTTGACDYFKVGNSAIKADKHQSYGKNKTSNRNTYENQVRNKSNINGNSFKCDTKYQAIVIGIHINKEGKATKFVDAMVENKHVSFYISVLGIDDINKVKKDTKVDIIYHEKNAKGFPMWEKA